MKPDSASALPKTADIVIGGAGVGVSADARPLLGQIPGVGGLYLCAGFSGMGFKISPAIGLVMSERLLDGKATSVDMSAFRTSRFAENSPIKSKYEHLDD